MLEFDERVALSVFSQKALSLLSFYCSALLARLSGHPPFWQQSSMSAFA
ncbi:hypothetical protein [Paracoccus sp. JM45]|nr:hypothetical protein [Paracoccus sp. JM45]